MDDGKCVKACPEKFIVVDGNKVCKKCVDIDPTKPLLENGECKACPDGQYFSNSACAATCTGGSLKPLSGQVCTQTCGQFQIKKDG